MNYKGLAITHIGTEDICAKEIKEIIKANNIKIKDTVVLFETDDLLNLCKLCYKSQSVFRILYLSDEIKIFPDLEKSINEVKKKKINFSNWLDKDSLLKVECERHGNHDFRSVDIASKIADIIKSKNKEFKFTYNNPDLIFYVYIYEDKGYIGLDFSGRDLSKRDYKIFQTRNSLKGTLAYSLIRVSGFKEGNMLVDPFCREGIIPIEASLFSQKFPVNYFSKDKFLFSKFRFLNKTDFDDFFKEIDSKIIKSKTEIHALDAQLRLIKFSQKNAKIAGVFKYINFSKKNIEWLDTKFEKNSVDNIVAHPLQTGKYSNIKEIEKTYNELFYQAEYILKNKGNICLISKETELLEKSAEKHKFKILEKREVYSGKLPLFIIKFSKKNAKL
ncbi:hypothetical protein JXB41_00610 [Candidatus Woesearchaeota archaeon]|nr:hypothetical protein [Candidatus Woesearchaeota archaeon]